MNLFSSERNQNWLIWIWCIKFHLFLWKLSDVFIAINRFVNKFNIYINFVQLCYQFYPPKVLLALFFHAIVLPLSCASLDLWGCRLSSKRGSFSHGGLILCSGLIQIFCTSSLLLLGLWHHLSAIKMTLSTKFIISSSSWSLQNLLNSTTVLHYFSATKMYATLYLFGFIDTKIYSTICL